MKPRRKANKYSKSIAKSKPEEDGEGATFYFKVDNDYIRNLVAHLKPSCGKRIKSGKYELQVSFKRDKKDEVE